MPADTLAGDWVGWAYLGASGDMPLRLRIDRDGRGYRARFDELVSRRYDLPVQRLEWKPPHLVVERTRPTGQVFRLEADWNDGALSGKIDWAGSPGRFELTRSPELLSRLAPERYADCEGSYRLAPERTIVVSSRSWGELLYTDLSTGRHGTLFPVDRDVFFIGSALYVPAPVSARVRFGRDADGKVTEMLWTESEAELRGPRLEFQEKELEFTSAGARLRGTLIRPVGEGRLPAAVILGGSNGEKRSDNRRDATILAAFGLATFIYDQRGYGNSEGATTVPFRQSAEDAVAAVRMLRSRNDIRGDQVGLTGRSRGGWFAPLAASLAPADVAFLILFVPPALSPAAQETTRRLNVMRAAGFSAAAVDSARQLLALTWAYGATRTGWDAYRAARSGAESAGYPEDLFEPATAEDPEWEWIRLNMQYDPRPAIESVRCPVLALFGEVDSNVVPADNVPIWRSALAKAGNQDVELIVVPGATHSLFVAAPGVPVHKLQGFGASGWPEVQRWLAAHVGVASGGK